MYVKVHNIGQIYEANLKFCYFNQRAVTSRTSSSPHPGTA